MKALGVILGGSWVVTSGVLSPLIIWVISIVTLRITLLIATQEPPSRGSGLGVISLHQQMLCPNYFSTPKPQHSLPAPAQTLP